MKKTCICCNCHYDAIRSDQLFCSKRCRKKYYSNPFTIIVSKEVLNRIKDGTQTEVYVKHSDYWTKRFLSYFGKYYDFTHSGTPMMLWNKHSKAVNFCLSYDRETKIGTHCKLEEGRGIIEFGAEPYTDYYILKIEYLH